MMAISPDDDGVRIRAEPSIAKFLESLPGILDGIDPDERVNLWRAPPVFPEDEEADREWWGYTQEELDRGRSDDRRLFGEVMTSAVAQNGIHLDRETALAVVRVAVDLRLALAGRIGIRTENDYETLEDGDAALLDALAGLQLTILRSLDELAHNGDGESGYDEMGRGEW